MRRLPLLWLLLVACSDSTVGTQNSAPNVTIEQPAPGVVVAAGATLDLVGSVSDTGTAWDALRVTWSSSLDGELGGGLADAEGRTELADVTLTTGEHTITLRALDAQGASGQDSVVAVVAADGPPTIQIDAPVVDGEYVSDFPITLATTVGDAEDPPTALSVTWTTDAGDVLVPDVAPDSAGTTSNTVLLQAGAWPLDATVTDSAGNTRVASVTIVVVAPNAGPSAPSVAIDPGAPETEDALTIVLAAPSVDADNGPSPITYAYAWTRDGAAVGPFVPPQTVPASETARGQTWLATVTAFDGLSTSVPATASVVVDNTPPSVVSVTITPTVATTGTLLTATPSGWSDPDPGDVETYAYAWFADGVPVGTDAATLPGTEFARDETITVEVGPFDGLELGAGVLSAGVTILNTPPTAPTVTISPAAPTDEDPLVCSVSVGSSDADLDGVLYDYDWSSGSSSATGATLPASATTAGQTWTCSVTPDDGTDAGPAGAASVSVVASSGCVTPSPNTCAPSCATPAACLNSWSTLACAPPDVTAAYFTNCASIPFSGATWCFVVEGNGFQLDYTTQGGLMKWGSERSGPSGFGGSNWNWLYADQLVVTVGSSYSLYVGEAFWIENPDGQLSDCVTIGWQP